MARDLTLKELDDFGEAFLVRFEQFHERTDKPVDPVHLERDLCVFPMDLEDVAGFVSEADGIFSDAKMLVETSFARAFIAEKRGATKVSDRHAEELARLNPEYLGACRALGNARVLVKKANGKQAALYERGHALRIMAKLWEAQYYSQTADILSPEAQERLNRANRAAGFGNPSD